MIARAIFSFTGRCNMQCPFCYVPFDGARASNSDVIRAFSSMLDRLQPASVTIGGGDPLMFAELETLVDLARPRVSLLQLDTNGKGLHRDRMVRLVRKVDLLGLPLESADSEVHDRMRAERGHYVQVSRVLATASVLKVPVKVNTVITSVNVDGIASLGKLVRASGVTRWSLYEFWNMVSVAGDSTALMINKSAFQAAIEEARQAARGVVIEAGSVGSRAGTHVFVRHTGSVYVVDRTDARKYIELGSIFDEAVLLRISEEVDLDRQATRLQERVR